MTVDELCLRIEAVFPGVSIGPGRSQIGVRADLPLPVDLIQNGVEIIGFEVWTTDTPLMVWSDVVDEDVLLEVVLPVEREIRRSIEGVSAHQLIAARRRRALEELARLDADLIMDEPAQVAANAH